MGFINNVFIFLTFLRLFPIFLPQNTYTQNSQNTEYTQYRENIKSSYKELFSTDLTSYSKIILTINTNGKHKILGEEFNNLPSLILVNEKVSYLTNNKEIELTETNNIIILLWDSEFYDCSYMFSNLNNIINIDFSEFNIQGITNMFCMFCNNYDIKNINFGSFNTSCVINMEKLFYNCPSLISLNLSFFNLNNVENMDLMFANSQKLENIIFNENKTIKLKSMFKIFYNCEALKFLDLSNFYTSNIINMESLFYNCKSLTSINLSNFDTSLVTNMENMFYNCLNLISLNISSFYTLYQVNTGSMFSECSNLRSIYFSDNNNIIYSYNMSHMFYNCKSLLSLDLSTFETSNVTNMEYMFYGCNQLSNINLISFNTSSVIDMNHMFYFCSSLKFLDLSKFYSLNTINMGYTFYGCSSLQYIYFSNINLIHINNMRYMFGNCYQLISLDLISFETSNVSDMGYMFYNCQNLNLIKNIEFNTSSASLMDFMFYNCDSLISLNLSSFIASNYFIDMHNMFENCNNLQYIYFPKYEILKIGKMESMFYDCISLISLDLSKFDTSHVENMSYIFYNCQKLQYLDISNFNTSSATDMFRMFKYCTSITSLDLSSFDTSKVTYMRAMFCCCNNLISLNLSHFDTSKVTDIRYIFEKCTSLKYLNIYNFTKTNVMTEYSYSFVDTNGFKYCLKENNIFFSSSYGLYYLKNAVRDCSDKCYSYNKFYISSTKTCEDNCKSISLYEYNSQCINQCPKRYKSSSNNICELLNCTNYLNAEQNDCIDTLPERYYLNDTILKTIDLCKKECFSCDIESTRYNLCISCNNNYYQKINDSIYINNYIKCYSDIEGYYLDKEEPIFFKPCYESCKSCDIKGNFTNHNCKICKSDYFYEFKFDNSVYLNCYKKCDFYFYHIKSINKYVCTQELECPIDYNKLSIDNGQCLQYCSDSNEYKYEFKNKCYNKCPNNTRISSINNKYCEPICQEENPFEIINNQECVKNCSIYSLENKLCRLNYNESNNDLIFINIENDLTNEYFNISQINEEKEIIIEGNNNIYTITLGDKNISEIDECDFALKNYYNITYNQSIYKIIANSKTSYNSNVKYEMYYPFNDKNLEKLNSSSICNYTCTEPKCLLCSQRSMLCDLCISCNENYYQIFNESSYIYSYINCYQNPERYYLDINESVYKLCYYTCQSCDKEGNNETHNCLSCNDNYNYSYNFYYDYYNCYNSCDYYFYYDNEKKIYVCTDKLECPENYSKLIINKNQCIDECNKDDIYKYEFKQKYYERCPNNTEVAKNNYFYCVPICSNEFPFELIHTQDCSSSCSIHELYNKLCHLKYNSSNVDPILMSIHNDLISENFSFIYINNNSDIVIKEKYAIINISLENKNISGLEQCDYILKDYYNISYNKNIYKVIINSTLDLIHFDIKYEMYYSLNGKNLEKLNISLCDYNCKEKKCLLCTQKSDYYNLCLSCNKNYFPILHDEKIIDPYINCYRDPEGYFLDINESIYKPCYKSCKFCHGEGNNETHNCIECKNKFLFEIDYFNYKNCYENCKYYHYYEKNKNKLYCTEEPLCPEKYNKIIAEKNQCIDKCCSDDIYKYEFRKKCYNKCPSNTEEKNYFCNIKCTKEFPFEEIETQECINSCSIFERQKKICKSNYISNETDSSKTIQDVAIDNVKEDLATNFNTSDIDNGENIVIEDENSTLTITTTENQKNNEINKNSTTINLGKCETKLKEHYKIPKNKSLYILKLDVAQEGMKIPKIEYEVYYPINGSNLEKLDLKICEDTKIEISIPVELNENIDKLNSSSDYYNDICYTFTTENGTDIPLEDRKKEFINNNKTLCEENCEFTRYNYETNKAVCSCNIKINLPLVSEIIIDKNKLYERFTDIKNIANFKILECYDILFTLEGFKNNYGSYILLPIIFFHLISSILIFSKDLKIINEQIKSIVDAKKSMKLKKSRKTKKKRKNTKKEFNINNNKTKRSKNIDINKIETKNNPFIKIIKKNNINNNINKINSVNINLITNIHNNVEQKKQKKDQNINSDKKILEYNDQELNSLSYEDALKNDKRSYLQYYYSILKNNHLLLFSFFPSNDYNSTIIKKDLFFINFSIFYTINAVFFNDKTMHKIYEDGGDFDLIYQIPQILYSSIISSILYNILKLLALSENIALEIKMQKNIVEINNRENKAKLLLKLKFIFFVFISFIFLFSFFYYLACFCAVYKNTQIHLIKDSIISFGLSLIYPFFIYLIPGFFRISALRAKNRENMYKFSQFLQII